LQAFLYQIESTMNYVDVVAMLAVLQYIAFGTLVGQARSKYGVKAPAVTGSEPFERVYRVQMNTLEQLVALLPALYVAARYWPAHYVAAIGVVYLVGRVVYWRAYVNAPQSRNLGFVLSIAPVFTLALMALVPALLGKSVV
jgi:glutathione S-transferase